MASPDIVNREKGSSHPLKPGKFYDGIVTYVDSSGRVTVNVKSLGATFGPVTPIGLTTLNKMTKNDVVKCTFTDEFFTDLVVFGSTKIKADVFASKTVVESLLSTITSLQNQIISLNNRVTALENA
jgi:hypothetical protein